MENKLSNSGLKGTMPMDLSKECDSLPQDLLIGNLKHMVL